MLLCEPGLTRTHHPPTHRHLTDVSHYCVYLAKEARQVCSVPLSVAAESLPPDLQALPGAARVPPASPASLGVTFLPSSPPTTPHPVPKCPLATKPQVEAPGQD